MTYWQVSAGGGKERDYSKIFLDYGVICIGSENPNFRKYMSKMEKDDIVILRKGASNNRWEIQAVGKVADDEFIDERIFEDVEGWCLEYARKVKWKVPREGVEVSGLRQGKLVRCNKNVPIRAANKIIKYGKTKKSKILPKPQDRMTKKVIVESLIHKRVKRKNAIKIGNTLNQLETLARWYNDYGAEYSEYEIRTFLIIPFLKSLGWKEGQMKLEFTIDEGKNKPIDIAFFRTPFLNHNEEDWEDNPCIMILESKNLDKYLKSDDVLQAQSYAEDDSECKRFVLSNGYCYKIFNKEKNEWKYASYLNLFKPTKRHPLYPDEIGGVIESCLYLMPDNV